MRATARASGNRTLFARLSTGSRQLRNHVREAAYRAQLGPSREDAWRDFLPRR